MGSRQGRPDGRKGGNPDPVTKWTKETAPPPPQSRLTGEKWKPTDEKEHCDVCGGEHYVHKGPTLGD